MGFSKLMPYHSSSGGKSHSKLRDLTHSHRDQPLELSIDIESPPCVLYGSATESSGALLSGLLTLDIKDPYENETHSELISPVNSRDGKHKNGLGSSLSSTLSHLSLSSPNMSPVGSLANLKIMSGYTKVCITSVTLTFVQKVQIHKPFLPDGQSFHSCMNCKTKTTNMKTWEIQKSAQDMPVGRHSFPFSYLIPGSVPAKSFLGLNSGTRIRYELIAVVTYKDPKRGSSSQSKQQLLQLTMPISVTRSIPRGPDKNSLRVFPPTELTATAVLPSVVYPKSTFPLEMKLNGISSQDRRWRMRKLAWRIEEISRVRCNTCDIHKHELKQLEKSVIEKESNKKPSSAIKKYDAGPQVRLTVGPTQDPALQALRRNSSLGRPRSGSEGPHDEDRDEEGPSNDFIHPNDDALRQQVLQQQQRAREQQVQEELKNDIQIYTEETRTVARGEIKSGWKTDFDSNGQVDLITDIDCTALTSGITNPITHVSTSKPFVEPLKQDTNVSCDIQDPTLGINVSHVLAVEIVVAEETLQYANGQPIRKSSTSAPSSKPNINDPDQRLAELSPMFANRNNAKARPVETDSLSPTKSGNSTKSAHSGKGNGGTSTGSRIISVPTGAARVLRMQFRLNLTERAGLGISWDEEVPPIYQDVGLLSPPSYENTISKSSTSQSLPSMCDLPSSTETRGDQLLAQSIAPPPIAHHHNSSSSLRALSSVQSPQLESVISIQGNNPFNDHLLTPHATRDIPLQNISERLDSDRITQ
ncbi:hypothetical protein HG537_0F04400 [Torulaspora globosa]|uniref:LDB19 N-terminal domain-containing protein n=1 Tax=Torulaspora globosa TaxID=48254 RepID=A0A7H9HWM8_9SACH|nr:hypothetical protein HG537_0F04400 [Torulaspora sp. CBS 2947]